VVTLFFLGLILFSSTITEEQLAWDLPSGGSTMGWGSEYARYFIYLSSALAITTLLVGSCADISAKKILGFATVFGSIGWLALVDTHHRNANIAGFFASLTFLSITLPLGKYACLAALRELTGPGTHMALFFIIGAVLRCAGSIWMVREVSLFMPIWMCVLGGILVLLFILFLIERNDLTWSDDDKKGK
jgi:hypothetical protein